MPFSIAYRCIFSCKKLVTKPTNNTGRFIMFSVITNIYNKKTKGPNLLISSQAMKVFVIDQN